MSTNNINENFYAEIPIYKGSLAALFGSEENFHSFPADWQVVLTDIKGSTQAVLKGDQETINHIATGSTTIVLNIAAELNIEIPFFFGGDGSTFIIPPTILPTVLKKLETYSLATKENYGMFLRVGNIAVADIANENQLLKIAKYESENAAVIPIIIGSGLQFADKKIKAEITESITEKASEELNVSGMLCRWDLIPPNNQNEEVITLLVVPTHSETQTQILANVLGKIDSIFGSIEQRQPISLEKLRLKSTFKNMLAEQAVFSKKTTALGWLKNQMMQWVGKLYYSLPVGKKQLSQIVKMSDTLVLDGKINTVITGTTAQRNELRDFLDHLESQNEIIYGLYVSTHSVMSCYVHNRDNRHYYFVDGAGGGFTRAAKELKSKIK